MQAGGAVLVGNCFADGHSRAPCLIGSHAYRVDGIVKTLKEEKQDAVSKYASTSGRITPARGNVDGHMRARGESALRRDDPCGLVRCRLWPPDIRRKTSPRSRERAGDLQSSRSTPSPSMGARVHQENGEEQFRWGAACAFSGRVEHVARSREFYAPLGDVSPGMLGMGD